MSCWKFHFAYNEHIEMPRVFRFYPLVLWKKRSLWIFKSIGVQVFTALKKALGMKNQLRKRPNSSPVPRPCQPHLNTPRAAGGTFQKLFLLFRREKFSARVLRRAVSQISYPPAKWIARWGKAGGVVCTAMETHIFLQVVCAGRKQNDNAGTDSQALVTEVSKKK